MCQGEVARLKTLNSNLETRNSVLKRSYDEVAAENAEVERELQTFKSLAEKRLAAVQSVNDDTHVTICAKDKALARKVLASELQRASARVIEVPSDLNGQHPHPSPCQGTSVSDVLSITAMGELDLKFNLERRLAEGMPCLTYSQAACMSPEQSH